MPAPWQRQLAVARLRVASTVAGTGAGTNGRGRAAVTGAPACEPRDANIDARDAGTGRGCRAAVHGDTSERCRCP